MDSLLKTILLATDGSEDADLAARAAGDLARKTETGLHVVHAWHTVPSAHFEGWINSSLEQASREVLDEQTGKIKDSGVEVSESHLKEGSPAQTIVGLADEIEADLIVMGSRGVGRIKRLATGSVSEGVVHEANVPVLVLRGGDEAWPPEHLVVGEDGSEPAQRAGELAAEIGNLLGNKMTLVRTYPEPPDVYEEGRKTDPRMTEDGLRRAEAELEKRADQLETILGSRPKMSIAVGDAAEDLVETAGRRGGKGTLIAVGSRGLGQVQRFRLGSVSTKVLRAAEGAVLISAPHS